MDQGQPILSISLLASNRKDAIRRCLDSLLPIMEQIPSELIIVDTGVTQEVKELFREYTDRVIPFLWCNDFAKARNCGLSEARGEWFLYIDDDEWFADAKEIIRFFQSGEYRHYGYANYIQRNFLDPEYCAYTDNWVSRMVRLTKETRFKSRIHEYLDPVCGAGRNLKTIANHTGYIYVTEEDRRKRYERNLPLLQEMVQEEPDNLRWAIQIAQEYYSVEEWEHLEQFCRDVLQNERYRKQSIMKRLAATFYAGLVESLLEQGKLASAIHEAEQVLANKDCSPLGSAYLMLQETVCYLEQREWTSAKSCIGKYFKLEREITADEFQYALWQEALIVDSAFDMINQKKACLARIICELEEEHEAEALRLFAKLEWDQKVVYAYPRLMPVLLEVLVEHSRMNDVDRIWRCIWKNRQLCDMIRKENNDCGNAWNQKRKTDLKEEYCQQVKFYLAQYYKQETIDHYATCLPVIAQRALGLMEERKRGEEGWQNEN